MFTFFAPKLALGLAGAFLVAGVVYTINDYIHLKSAYKVAQKTIQVLEHRRQVTDKAMVEVERKQNENFKRSHKALLEMDKQGFIATRHGDTPCWLRATAEDDC